MLKKLCYCARRRWLNWCVKSCTGTCHGPDGLLYSSLAIAVPPPPDEPPCVALGTRGGGGGGGRRGAVMIKTCAMNIAQPLKSAGKCLMAGRLQR